MSKINTGILYNAVPLSAERIGQLEKQVLENKETFAYLDENSELCFATSTGVEGIKDLAWHNAYELTAENDALVKKAYKKDSLDSFYLNETFTKQSLTDSWQATAPAQIEALEGSGSEYYTTAPSVLSFRSTAPLNELQDVQINGQTVDPSHYTLEEGSTIVKLSIDYLKTLDLGNHEISVISNSQTAKGDFIVKAPALNKYGFYYNQPYYAGYVELGEPGLEAFTGTIAFIINEDNTAFVINYDAENMCEAGFSVNGSEYTIKYAGCDFTGYFSSDGLTFKGTSASCPGFGSFIPDYYGPGVDFTLDSTVLCADEDYLYLCDYFNQDHYKVLVKDLTKLTVGPIKSNIHNKPVSELCNSAFHRSSISVIPQLPNSITTLGHYAFNSCENLTDVVVPDFITEISSSTFAECKNLKSVVLPNSITVLGDYIFAGCVKLNNITFNGTCEQWAAVEKGERWNSPAYIRIIYCVDGQVTI